ncbi:MAG: PQQ-binding-like beta-propeller repeat protein [Spirochaetes bacterium]|nr:PQQ-binding-like beta-propeller repeat protein [Spirochaetota bacterium]
MVQTRALRWLPGVVIVAVQWLLWLVIPLIAPGDSTLLAGVAGGMVGGLAVLLWWAFFSRAPGVERWGAPVLMAVALAVASRFIHVSIRTGNMGLMFALYAIPVMSLAFVVWAAGTRNLPDKVRRAALVATVLLASGGWILVRNDGITGHAGTLFTWRWAPTAEEKSEAVLDREAMSLPGVEATTIRPGADWPGFRGADRDGVARGLRIAADWSARPPKELWRRPVGPGCSSFAVRGGLLYTQEQRGAEEVVACYHLDSGKPAWRHGDAARFYDSHAGAGPRATPTLDGARVYALGATGILNALDARSGSVVWSRNAARDTESEPPNWGMAGSPLVLGDAVIVSVSGALAAYDLATGGLRWRRLGGGKGYSSPHRIAAQGSTQILFMNQEGAQALAPTDGAVLWKLPWPGEDRIVQPAVTAEGDLILGGGGMDYSIRRLAISRAAEGWTVSQRWASRALQPNFNDTLIHDGHAYGYLGPRLACLDLKDGKKCWQGAPDAGFTLLMPEQGLILVLSEKGELVLVEAKPGKYTERARMKALTGKTWNHPALAGDILLVRNAQEMAAYRLPREI